MVGYHGLSSRPSYQRHSGAHGSNNQTGWPKAPARWASAVSTVTIKSMRSAANAVAPESSRWGARSTASGKWVSAAYEASFCRLNRPTFGASAKRAKRAAPQERLRSFSCAGLPAQALPIFLPAGRLARAPSQARRRHAWARSDRAYPRVSYRPASPSGRAGSSAARADRTAATLRCARPPRIHRRSLPPDR